MKKELNLIFLLMLFSSITATITGDAVVIHSNEYEKYDGEVDNVFHPNTHAKYDGHPNAQEKYAVEPLFFREKMLKEGVVMQMPDIRDKLPKRSFLPRTILAKLPPFSTSNMVALKGFFKVSDNSRTEKMMRDSIRECERAPARGESKRCVRSKQEMVDFATPILGHNVVVHTTQNINGSSKYVMIGQVHRINGGNVTQSVTCHQHMFPYVLLYFCHSVPMVRIYQVDLLDPKSNDKINQAIVVCHLDTSSWSRANRAFVELGSGPGRIEACHWVFENDMAWTLAD